MFAPTNGAAYLANTYDSFRSRVARSGLILISEMSEGRVEGALFGLELGNPLGTVTDQWPFGRIGIER